MQASYLLAAPAEPYRLANPARVAVTSHVDDKRVHFVKEVSFRRRDSVKLQLVHHPILRSFLPNQHCRCIGRFGSNKGKNNFPLGAEAVGIVMATGPGVSDFQVGAYFLCGVQRTSSTSRVLSNWGWIMHLYFFSPLCPSHGVASLCRHFSYL